jgi:hypothetical protein
MAAVKLGWIEIPVALNPWAIRSQTAWLIQRELPMDSKRQGFKPGSAPEAHTVVGCSDWFGGLGDLSITAKMKAEMFPTPEISQSTIFLSKLGFGTGRFWAGKFFGRLSPHSLSLLTPARCLPIEMSVSAEPRWVLWVCPFPPRFNSDRAESDGRKREWPGGAAAEFAARERKERRDWTGSLRSLRSFAAMASAVWVPIGERERLGERER